MRSETRPGPCQGCSRCGKHIDMQLPMLCCCTCTAPPAPGHPAAPCGGCPAPPEQAPGAARCLPGAPASQKLETSETLLQASARQGCNAGCWRGSNALKQCFAGKAGTLWWEAQPAPCSRIQGAQLDTPAAGLAWERVACLFSTQQASRRVRKTWTAASWGCLGLIGTHASLSTPDTSIAGTVTWMAASWDSNL